jgi:hypothetical protein
MLLDFLLLYDEPEPEPLGPRGSLPFQENSHVSVQFSVRRLDRFQRSHFYQPPFLPA